MPPTFALFIDGVHQPSALFAVPGMSLSSARSRMVKRSFVLSFVAAEVVAYLAPMYEAWVVDSRKDDEQCGSPQDELAEAGYPSLNKVVETPNLLELVVGHYLFSELFGPQAWDGRDPIDYWCDQTISCSSDRNTIRVEGICYSVS